MYCMSLESEACPCERLGLPTLGHQKGFELLVEYGSAWFCVGLNIGKGVRDHGLD